MKSDEILDQVDLGLNNPDLVHFEEPILQDKLQPAKVLVQNAKRFILTKPIISTGNKNAI